MQVLLVYNREDTCIVTLRNAVIKCGYSVKCCKNIEETHESFKKVNYDLVFIDCRRSQSNSSVQSSKSNNSNFQFGENICRFIRKIFQYSVIVALTNQYNEKDLPSVLPFLKIGFNKTFTETTNLNRCMNELLTLEYGEVSNVKRLQAAHALFTALEYTSDPVEIMNDEFKLLYVNNAFEKLTGYSLNELSGQDFNKVHKLNSDEFLLKIAQGNVCASNLTYENVNQELNSYSSLTIPIIAQGETKKISNYVTITNLSNTNNKQTILNRSKFKEEMNDSCKLNERNDSKKEDLKRPTIVNLPNKQINNDFSKFALDALSGNSKEPFRKSSSHATQNNLESLSPSLTEDSISVNTYDDEKLLSSNQLNDYINKSYPEIKRDIIPINTYNSYVQRKRSYDITKAHLNDHGQRRHSMARVIPTHEAPIRKVINQICLAHEKSNTNIVKDILDKALDILRSTELYSPSMLENDKLTSDLVSGLMSVNMTSGLEKKIQKANNPGAKTSFYLTPLENNNLKNLPPEIDKILETSDLWSCDIIALERMTEKRPLVTLGLNIMNKYDVCNFLKINESTLVNWLALMESKYKSSNQYHNSTHAADVLHATAYFLSTSKISEIFDETDKVASLVAAVIHDLNHPGRTNAFLCNSNNELAILYNDQAVLENHHSALAFQLTHGNESANIFKNLNRDEYRALRSVIIDMVLATEMNKHFEHLNKFVNKFSVSDDEINQVKNLEFLKSSENKLLIKRILIKCADVSNPCRPLDICKEWANRIAAEYFEQTDDEKKKGLPVVMPTFDRLTCNIPKAQISFIEYFISEMYEAWDDFIDVPEIINNLQLNTLYWRNRAEKQQLKVTKAAPNDLKEAQLNISIREDTENESDYDLDDKE